MFFIQEDQLDKLFVEGDKSSLKYLPRCSFGGFPQPVEQIIFFQYDKKLLTNLPIEKNSSLGKKFGENVEDSLIVKSAIANFTSFFNKNKETNLIEQIIPKPNLRYGTQNAANIGYVPKSLTYFSDTKILQSFYLYTNFYKELVDLYRSLPPKSLSSLPQKSLIEILSEGKANQITDLKNAFNGSGYEKSKNLIELPPSNNKIILNGDGFPTWLKKISQITKSNEPFKKILLPANRQNTELPETIYIKHSINQTIPVKIIWSAKVRLKYEISSKVLDKQPEPRRGSGIPGELTDLKNQGEAQAEADKKCKERFQNYIQKNANNKEELKNIVQQQIIKLTAKEKKLNNKFITDDFNEQITIENNSIYIDMQVTFAITNAEVNISADIYIPYKLNKQSKLEGFLNNNAYGFYKATAKDYQDAINLAKVNWNKGENLTIPIEGINLPDVSLFIDAGDDLPKTRNWKDLLFILLEEVSFVLPLPDPNKKPDEGQDQAKCCCGQFIIDAGDDPFAFTESKLRDIKVTVLAEK
jgi:hypothetical protein